MKTIKQIQAVILLLFLITSCSKEKRMKHNLWSNGGKWNIVKWEDIQTSNWPANNNKEIVYNAGIFHFDKNGEGWLIESYGADFGKIDITYYLDGDKLHLKYGEGTDGETYTIDWKKNAFTLTQEFESKEYYPAGNGVDSTLITNNYIFRYTCEKE